MHVVIHQDMAAIVEEVIRGFIDHQVAGSIIVPSQFINRENLDHHRDLADVRAWTHAAPRYTEHSALPSAKARAMLPLAP